MKIWTGRATFHKTLFSISSRHFKIIVVFRKNQSIDTKTAVFIKMTMWWFFFHRVHSKPYVELKDSDGRPDEEVAKEVGTESGML